MRLSARVVVLVGKFLPNIIIFSILLFLYVAIPHHNSIVYAAADEDSTQANVPNNQHTKTQTTLIELSSALICQLVGIDVINPQKGCLGINPVTKEIGYATPGSHQPQIGGLIGMVTQSAGSLYTPPASGISYTQNLARNFGIVKPALAQEEDYTGFTALQPVQYVWTVIRNLTYFFFVIAFVIIGMAIMLRVKINPQTVMSVQNQLPKIAIAILMITFSYAIVGFLIDIMWVLTYFFINTLSPAITVIGGSDSQAVQKAATTNLYNNPMIYFMSLFDGRNSGNPLQDNILGSMSLEIGATIGDVISKVLLALFGVSSNLECKIGLTDFDLSACVGSGLSFFFGILGTLIILAALLAALIKTWFMLIRSYVYILLYTIIGPIYIFMGIMPGSTLGVGNWLRAIFANLLVFPSVIALFLLARFFAVSNSPFSVQNNINTQYNPFLPPLIGNPSLLNNVGLIIGFGIVMLAPEIIAVLRDSLKAKPNPYVAPAVQGGFALGAGMAMKPVRGTIGNLFKTHNGAPIGAAAQRIFQAGQGDDNKNVKGFAPLRRKLTAPLRFGLGLKDGGGKH